ncbi:MAG TPA: hypothetical protein VEJ18_15850, partial [Planctomycetota bacterium]|nr:hypothetical protein [Planctomycetota bacterium]
PKPEPKPEDPAAVQKARLAKASQLVREATPEFEQVTEASRSLPTEEAAVADLQKRLEALRSRLQEARRIYIEEKAADPAKLERRAALLESLLETIDGIASQLKR